LQIRRDLVRFKGPFPELPGKTALRDINDHLQDIIQIMASNRTGIFPIALLLLAVVLLIGSCSIIPRNEFRPVANGEDWRVRLVKYSMGSEIVKRGGFEHPFDINPARLNNILSSIYVQDNNVVGKKSKYKLFPAKVRRVLLQPLHEAFQKAQPDEVIDFSFMLGKSFLMIFNNDLFTSGIFFKKDGKLNLVMRVVSYQCDNYQSAIRQFVSDPTKRALANDWSFVLMPGMELKKHRKKGFGFFQEDYYSNWLIIDLDRVYEPVKNTVSHFENVIKTPPAVNSQPEPDKPEPEEFRPPNATLQQAPVPKAIDDPEVRRKIQVLRELYNSGAISRSTYERKKEEILSH